MPLVVLPPAPLIVPSPRQVCSQLAGHLRGSPEGSDAHAEETTAATYTGMCIFGIAFSLGYTVGAYLIGSEDKAVLLAGSIWKWCLSACLRFLQQLIM